jgi:hypothetical protein
MFVLKRLKQALKPSFKLFLLFDAIALTNRMRLKKKTSAHKLKKN